MAAEIFWAKTTKSGEPAITVWQHIFNVGAVARELETRLGFAPVAGSVTAAASHDVGKISMGFSSLCPAWLEAHPEWKPLAEQHAAASNFVAHGAVTRG